MGAVVRRLDRCLDRHDRNRGRAATRESSAASPTTSACSRAATVEPRANLTEIAFAAGAGGLLVGTVEYSDYPPAARQVPLVGNAWRVDVERVLA
jgi:iron complex transport system substrate-binding protein